MAVSVGNTSGDEIANGTSKTLSHNCNGTVLVVGIALCSNGTLPASYSVTFNSVAMTLCGVYVGTKLKTAFFYLVNPSQGTYNVSASWTNNGWGSIAAISLTGVNLLSPIDSGPTGYGYTAAAATQDVPSTPGGLVIDCAMCWQAEYTAIGSGQTGVTEFDGYGDPGYGSGVYASRGISYEAGATTVTMSWTYTGGPKAEYNTLAIGILAGGVPQIISF